MLLASFMYRIILLCTLWCMFLCWSARLAGNCISNLILITIFCNSSLVVEMRHSKGIKYHVYRTTRLRASSNYFETQFIYWENKEGILQLIKPTGHIEIKKLRKQIKFIVERKPLVEADVVICCKLLSNVKRNKPNPWNLRIFIKSHL